MKTVTATCILRPKHRSNLRSRTLYQCRFCSNWHDGTGYYSSNLGFWKHETRRKLTSEKGIPFLCAKCESEIVEKFEIKHCNHKDPANGVIRQLVADLALLVYFLKEHKKSLA